MINKTVTHVLVAAGGNGATQRIIDELQQEGMAVSAATADTKQELANLVQQPQWEVIICFEDCKLSVPLVSDLAAKSTYGVPAILVTTAGKVGELLPMLDQGIADVVPGEQAKRLFLSVQREAANSRLKRELLQSAKAQAELEDRHCSILSGSAYPISYVHDGMHLYCNQSYASLFGFDNTDAVTAIPFLNLIQEQDQSLVNTLMAQPAGKEESLAIRVVLRDGTESDMMLTFTAVEFQKKPCMQLSGRLLMGAAKEKIAAARTATELLGNLQSDAQFAEQIEAAIRAAPDKEVFSSLLVIALNEQIPVQAEDDRAKLNLMFNGINRFLKDYIQKPFAIARLDERVFGILVEDADTDEIAALTALAKSTVNKHYSLADETNRDQNCTIGSTLINGREHRVELVLAQASKHLKPAQVDKIKQKMLQGRTATNDTDMLDYLTTALAQKRFKLLYQPVVHIKGSNHKGYEVLSRMLDSEGNEIMPEAFIRVANLNGIGEKLDKLLIGMALDSLEKADKSGSLIINIANNTLMSRTFLPWLQKQLEKRQIPPGLFAIAISETDIHNNESHAIDFCRGLSAAGLKFVISHFGCDADPFSVLAEIKPDLVKLDSSLLRDINRRSTQRTTVQSLVANLHSRGLLVVAPQVEALATLPILWDSGIDYVQGYCLQAPSQEMNYNFLVEEEITLSAGRI